ncbi:MAG: ThiF family adenylyltransferase [Solirubrobacterales bacterium]
MEAELSDIERKRYSAQIAAGGFGLAGQQKLAQARALVVGAGRVGSTVAAQLASAGTGYLGVADGETIADADLASQSMHFTLDLGASKADSVAAKLGVLNPQVQVDSFPVEVTPDNCEAIVAGHDLVVTCVGDRATRLLVNDACVAAGILLVDCVAGGARGAVQPIDPGRSACLRCSAFEASDAGATPALAAAVGALGAIEAVKLMSRTGVASIARIELDVAAGSIELPPLARDECCEVCESAAQLGQEVHA